MNTKINLFNFYSPRLDSSPVPVLFIPFKNNEKKCSYCGIEYSKTLKFEQKYCKNCLFRYIKHMDNDVCLNKDYSAEKSEYKEFQLTECGQKHHYKIYSEWVESILTKKSIQILYLSWWDNFDKCVVCLKN
ncbi:kinase-like domain-containing protein [Rhizophagus irregularis DAOM 181602=DAOM 197198]|nr:kinase-like domain-containing protein [Rhizophagus irregularis DAOM 181602=DAOM 197198]